MRLVIYMACNFKSSLIKSFKHFGAWVIKDFICERLMMIMKGIYYPCRKLETEAVSELFQKIFNDYLK